MPYKLIRLPFFLIIIIGLLLQSCASILNFPKQPVVFNTDNSKAVVTIDGTYIGEGERIRTKLKRDMHTKQIKVEGLGNKTNYYCVFQSKRSPLYIFSIVPFAVLFAPPFMDVFSKSYNYRKNISIPLSTTYQIKSEQLKFLNTTNVAFDVKDIDFKEYTIKIRHLKNNLEKKKREQDLQKQKSNANNKTDQSEKFFTASNTIFAEELNTVLKQRGFGDTTNSIFKDDNNTLFLSPVVNNLSYIKIVPNNDRRHIYTSYYIVESTISWKILNSYDEVLSTIKINCRSGEFTRDYYKDANVFYHKILNDLIQNSLNQLLTDKTMVSMMQMEEAKKAQNLPVFTIKSPTGIIESLEDAKNATLIVKTALGHGSAFAIDNEGHLITNYHVIAGKTINQQTKPQIITSEDEIFEATIVRTGPVRDIALLKIEKNFDRCFHLPLMPNFELADEVSTIGTPRSIELGLSLAKGIISSEQKTATTNLIGLNMSVNGGNSGGPLFKNNGSTLVGVVNSKLVGPGVSGNAFCIPAYKISEYLHLNIQ